MLKLKIVIFQLIEDKIKRRQFLLFGHYLFKKASDLAFNNLVWMRILSE